VEQRSEHRHPDLEGVDARATLVGLLVPLEEDPEHPESE